MYIITALPVGNLARVMTPVSPLKLHVQFALLLQKNGCKKLHKGNGTSGSKKATLLVRKDDELDLLGDDVESFTGTNADLESAADNLFTSPPRPQPLPFSSLSLKTPAKTVPPTPGTALQQKIESNLEKSLGNTLNLHLQQQMGSFQASMLEAFQSLRDELSSKKQAEVVQTSASASRPGTSAVNLDLPLRHLPLTFKPRIWMWTMVQHFLQVSDLIIRISRIRTLMHLRRPAKKASDRPKRHSHRKHDVVPRSASGPYADESDQPRMSSTKPKKHADKSKYKSRSRYVSSSSEKDQPSVAKHRSSKPSGANSDQDQPQHDPDAP